MAARRIEIERLVPEDWRRFRALRLRALGESPEAFGTALAAWSGEHDREERWRARLTGVPRNLLASLDGIAAGICSVTAPDEAKVAELISLYVAAEARGTGVAGALIGAALEEARDLGARAMHLLVYETNLRAAALYRRHGFRETGEVVLGDDGRRELVMRRAP